MPKMYVAQPLFVKTVENSCPKVWDTFKIFKILPKVNHGDPMKLTEKYRKYRKLIDKRKKIENIDRRKDRKNWQKEDTARRKEKGN
jgi:hypothetical protein